MRRRVAHSLFVFMPVRRLVLSLVFGALGVCSAQNTSLAQKTSDISLQFQSEFWYADIDYDPPESPTRDGDISLLAQRLDIGLPGDGLLRDTELGFKVALGIEEYAQGNHTDIQQYRIELRRQWHSENGKHPFYSFGLGFNFWNNDYSSNDSSNEEYGPTILVGAGTEPLGWDLRGKVDVIWQPVDLGDSEEFEFYEIDASLSRDFPRFDIELGYRMKNYYESRDDYLYHGPFIRGGFSF